MKKSLKTGILIFLLVVPVFIFLFLKNFGQNHYTLRTYYPQKVDSTVINGKLVMDTVYHRIPDFKLLNQNGDSIDSEDLEGKVYVANFIFTRCPSICPKMTSQLSRVQNVFKGKEELKLISHSIDPEYDSREVLERFAKENGADTSMWYFVTGDKKQMYDLAHKGYFISAVDEGGTPDDISHSEKFVLVDKDGQIRGYYNGTDPEEVDRLILEINILLYEYKNSGARASK